MAIGVLINCLFIMGGIALILGAINLYNLAQTLKFTGIAVSFIMLLILSILIELLKTTI